MLQKSIVSLGYELNDQFIKRVNSVRDLGITLDVKLIFDEIELIDQIFKKASKVLRFIIRRLRS